MNILSERVIEPHVERFWDAFSLCPVLRAVGQTRRLNARQDLAVHVEDCFEIHLVLDGSVDFWVQAETYHLQPGSLFFTQPGQLHGGVENIVQPCTLLWLQIDPRHVTDRALLARFYQIQDHCWQGAKDLVFWVEKILRELRQPQTDSPTLLEALVRVFMLEFLRSHAKREQVRARPKVLDKLLQTIEHYLVKGRPMSLNTLCAQSGLGRSRIFQLFESYIGQSPMSYINRRRVEEVKQKLIATDASITEIAMALQYSSSQHLATAFKKYTGMTPKAYRMKYQSFTKRAG